jgi:hypothetical protein
MAAQKILEQYIQKHKLDQEAQEFSGVKYQLTISWLSYKSRKIEQEASVIITQKKKDK